MEGEGAEEEEEEEGGWMVRIWHGTTMVRRMPVYLYSRRYTQQLTIRSAAQLFTSNPKIFISPPTALIAVIAQ